MARPITREDQWELAYVLWRQALGRGDMVKAQFFLRAFQVQDYLMQQDKRWAQSGYGPPVGQPTFVDLSAGERHRYAGKAVRSYPRVDASVTDLRPL